jgi:hypothetical protein
MAPKKAACPFPEAAKRAILLHSLNEILATAGVKTANGRK